MKPMLKGLAVLMGGGKGKDAGDEESPASEPGPKLEDEHLTDAFDALHSRDRRAFIDSMKAAFRACMAAEESGEYENDSEKPIGQMAE